MNTPQKYLTYLMWLFMGAMALGNVVGVLNDTFDFVTVPIAVGGTILIILFWVVAQQYLKRFPWQTENGRITHRLLLFNGGHLCWMTAEEIDQAKAAALAWQWEAAEEEVLSGRALLWLRMAVASHNPPGLKECWRCSDWRPDSPREIPCPKCGADDIPF